MKYYAITKGKYSDYHIIAITADKKKAELIAKWHSNSEYDTAMVEEYEDSIEVQMPIYHIFIENGKIEDCEPHLYEKDEERFLNKIDGLKGWVYVHARGEEEAKKIVYDLIAEYKAKNSGIA